MLPSVGTDAQPDAALVRTEDRKFELDKRRPQTEADVQKQRIAFEIDERKERIAAEERKEKERLDLESKRLDAHMKKTERELQLQHK